MDRAVIHSRPPAGDRITRKWAEPSSVEDDTPRLHGKWDRTHIHGHQRAGLTAADGQISMSLDRRLPRRRRAGRCWSGWCRPSAPRLAPPRIATIAENAGKVLRSNEWSWK